MGIKEDMARAKTLIQQKRYQDARAILRTINHAKAYEWLDKLDQIAPEFDDVPAGKSGKRVKKKGGRLWLWVTLFIVVALVAGVGWYAWTINRTLSETALRAALTLDLQLICMEVYRDSYNPDYLANGCDNNADYLYEYNNEEVIYCYEQSERGLLENTFVNCLVDTDILMIPMFDDDERTEIAATAAPTGTAAAATIAFATEFRQNSLPPTWTPTP